VATAHADDDDPTVAYTALAPVYDRLLRNHRERIEALVEAALDRHQPHARHACDVGCGTGALLERLARRGLRVTGVERSRAMAELARARLRPFADARVRVDDMRRLELTEPADLISATLEVVNHLASPAELEAFLRRVRRALVPGGLLWMDASTNAWFRTLWCAPPRTLEVDGVRSTWTASYDAQRRRGVMKIAIERHGQRPAHDRLVMRPFDLATVRRALARAGLDEVEATPLTGVTLGPRTGRVAWIARRPHSAPRPVSMM